MVRQIRLAEKSETYLNLREFITTRMRMAHVYQPVMLIELLSRGGEATVTDIAKSLLAHDKSQVEYYENITKNMVGKVLTTGNGITEKLKDGRNIIGYRINGAESLSEQEVGELKALCEQKVSDYVGARGESIWAHRKKSVGYISGTLKYEVLKRAKFRCELCGISAEAKALEVDHIVPRNCGGDDSLANFQALCFSCNAMKRDRDDTDFRGVADSYSLRESGCLFCQLQTDESREVLAENELCYAIDDAFAVTKHHSLIIPKRHVDEYFGLYQPELNAANALLQRLRERVVERDKTVTGFNIGVNSGQSAGQTIFHCHIHLIPRRDGDVEKPRGGVRAVIPGKQSY